MIILGIDPGIGKTGWGVIEVKGSTIKAQGYGCIETKINSEIPGRLFAIYDELQNIIKEYKPDAVAIEELFFNKNIKTALVVGQARGVIILAAIQNNMSVVIYTPTQIKMALTGYGRAEKMQIGKMVQLILKLKEIPKPDDTSDALAIAVTHGFSMKIQKR